MTRHSYRSDSPALEQNVQGSQQAPRHDTNWDPDRFPTSAKPVFRSTFLLICVLALICGIVYYSSDHADPTEQQRRDAARQQFLGEDGSL